jgi:integrase/recombinase XerD
MTESLPTVAFYRQGLSPSHLVPSIITASGEGTLRRYLEFFAAHIRNVNTRAAYLAAAVKFFGWCESNGIHDLSRIQKLHLAAYIEGLTREQSAPTVKQNLAAIRMLFEFLRVPQDNPAEGVRGPKHVVRTGRTPVLTAAQARTLLESIDITTVSGLRDRALLAVMIYSFARVSAVVGMSMEDYYLEGTRRWVRLREKGGKQHAVPLHFNAEEYVEAYVHAAGIGGSKGPLFCTLDKQGNITPDAMNRHTAWEMVKRRAKAAGLPTSVTNHSMRATGITVYLDNGGTIENARNIAAHASIKTTQMYDRRGDKITMDEISRIRL